MIYRVLSKLLHVMLFVPYYEQRSFECSQVVSKSSNFLNYFLSNVNYFTNYVAINPFHYTCIKTAGDVEINTLKEFQTL